MKWYEWTRVIRDECDAPAEIRALLMILATYADADGRSHPSLDTLARNLGVHRATAKRRRNRAAQLGWLEIVAPGRWVGQPTRYRLIRKGSTDAPLRIAERGASVGGRGVHLDPIEGSVGAPRTFRTFHEGDDDAPSMARSSLEERRQLARAIREAINPAFKERFQERFAQDYGHLYGKRPAA